MLYPLSYEGGGRERVSAAGGCPDRMIESGDPNAPPATIGCPLARRSVYLGLMTGGVPSQMWYPSGVEEVHQRESETWHGMHC